MSKIKPAAWIAYSDDGDGHTDAEAVLGENRPSYCDASEPLYTAAQLHAARDAALEEAAKVCERLSPFANIAIHGGVTTQCADAILALKRKQQK